MARWRERRCEGCGEVELTASPASLCARCCLARRQKDKIERERRHLESLGYEICSGPVLDRTGHRRYVLRPPCCGREFEPTYSNVLKQLAAGSKLPCRWCGGERRINAAMGAYVKKYGAVYDTGQFRDYRRKVSRLTERVYAAHRHIINPLNLRRGRTAGTYHLDHKVPIIWCFKNSVAPEVAAGLNNLQLLPMQKNLEKGRQLVDDEEARQVLFHTSVSAILDREVPGWGGVVVHDYENVFTTGVVTVREGEFRARPEAVISRLRHKLGQVDRRLGARNLDVRPVPPGEERQFLDRWHVQGWAASREAIGLYDKDELVALMSFSVPRYRQHRAQHELLRYAVKGGVSVAGGASRLFRAWVRQHPLPVVAYSLNRWGDGEMYRRLGFTRVSSTSSPAFIWPDGKMRSWRASVLRSRRYGIDIDSLTKVHDPGSTTWIYDPKNDEVTPARENQGTAHGSSSC